jgi:hypothetical protein
MQNLEQYAVEDIYQYDNILRISQTYRDMHLSENIG